MKLALTVAMLILIGTVGVPGQENNRPENSRQENRQENPHQQNPKKPPPRDVAIEVIPVLEFPLNLHEAALVKSEKGYALKCRFSSNADGPLIGIRYSLTMIEPVNGARPLTNRIEGFEISAYGTKTLTFPTPIKFRQTDGCRLVLMLEQVVSKDSIWEVIKAKDVLEGYVKGDYSIQPHVLRVANQVDAPLQTRVIF
jgi:hypothetical protein